MDQESLPARGTSLGGAASVMQNETKEAMSSQVEAMCYGHRWGGAGERRRREDSGESLRKDNASLERIIACVVRHALQVLLQSWWPQGRECQLIGSLQVLASKPAAASKPQRPWSPGLTALHSNTYLEIQREEGITFLLCTNRKKKRSAQRTEAGDSMGILHWFPEEVHPRLHSKV